MVWSAVRCCTGVFFVTLSVLWVVKLFHVEIVREAKLSPAVFSVVGSVPDAEFSAGLYLGHYGPLA